jgi:hypothetical protein
MCVRPGTSCSDVRYLITVERDSESAALRLAGHLEVSVVRVGRTRSINSSATSTARLVFESLMGANVPDFWEYAVS